MPLGIAAVLAGVGAIGSIGGSLITSGAASDAVNAQTAAAQQANQLQAQQFNVTQANLSPYISTGQAANALLAGGVANNSFNTSPFTQLGTPVPYAPAPFTLDTFQQSPGYQYNLQQGTNAIQNSAVGATGTLSGNTLKALQSNAMGLANQDWYNAMNQYYNQYNTAYNANNTNYWNQYQALNNTQQQAYNQLMGVSQQGLGAATGQASLGQQNINQQQANLLYAGNVNAAGSVAQGNALAGGLQGVTNTLMQPMPNYNNTLAANLLGLQNQSGYQGNLTTDLGGYPTTAWYG